ncbi:MAG: hypothetical protein ACXQTS_05545 [Candidatus Methanospirareceae archaeon]
MCQVKMQHRLTAKYGYASLRPNFPSGDFTYPQNVSLVLKLLELESTYIRENPDGTLG